MEDFHIEAQEGQQIREALITALLMAKCPDLGLHSRTGRGDLRTQIPRLRFDRYLRLGWLWNLFLSAKEKEVYRLAMTVTGAGHAALQMKDDYPEIEIHLYDHSFLKGVERMAAEYRDMTGKMVTVFMDAGERIPHRRPMFRFAIFACVIALAVVGFRLASIEFVKYIFKNL